MKNLNKRRLTTFLFYLKKRLLACVPKAGKRKKVSMNNVDVYDDNNQRVEIQIEDEEDRSIATCRICFDCEVDEDDHLISPCICKGSLKFVHRSCLDHWRSVKAGFDFSHCPTCKAQFHLRVLDETSWNKTKFKLFVTRDIFLVFLCLQTMIGMMGGLAYLADTQGSLSNHSWFRILPKHPISFYYCVGVLTFFALLYLLGLHRFILKFYDLWMVIKQSGPCCYCLPEAVDVCLRGLVVAVSALTLAGILYVYFTASEAIEGIWRRHSHILVIDYTQIYVVEDLKGCYSPAKLDPEEMERLRMLKLL